MCAIHDLSLKLTGTSVKRDVLYCFGSVDSIQHIYVSCETTSSLDLWHRQMGHPSEKIVKLLPHVSHFRSNFDKACDTCFYAKHP